MTHFALPLHALREELIEIAGRWASEHELHVSLERWYPTYGAMAVPFGGDVADCVAQFEPVRRIALRRGEFYVAAVNQMQHLVQNPESFVMVLEPLTEDGLRATALTSRMGDEDALRWWVGLVREELANVTAGAWAVEPELGGRKYIAEHCYTEGARDLAAEGVRMLAATGSMYFEFDDLR